MLRWRTDSRTTKRATRWIRDARWDGGVEGQSGLVVVVVVEDEAG